jgi:arginase family enzyme
MIAQHPLTRGFDLVEVAPSLDVANLTSIVAAAMVMHFLGGTKKKLEKKA